MEEQDLLRLTLTRYILSITRRNKACCVSHYQAIYGASHGGTGAFASHITKLYIEHHMEEQNLFRLTLPGYILSFTWRKMTCCVSHYQAINGSSPKGTGPVRSHIITLYIEYPMEEQDQFRLNFPGYILSITRRNKTYCVSHYHAIY